MEQPFFSLQGRTAVITGGARGIGLAIAHRLAAAGAKIAIVDFDAEANDAAAPNKEEGNYATLNANGTTTSPILNPTAGQGTAGVAPG